MMYIYMYMYFCPSMCKMIHVCVCYAQTQKFVEYKKWLIGKKEKNLCILSVRENPLCVSLALNVPRTLSLKTSFAECHL